MTSNGGASHRSWAQLALVAGAITVALGALTLVGWAFGVERLTALRDGLMPMAPSTAVLFVLFGGLLMLDTQARPAPAHRPWKLVLAGGGTSVATALLVLSSARRSPGVEHLWLEISGDVAGAPIGHMSPLTALGFVLAGSSYLLATPPTGARRLRVSFLLGGLVSVLALTLALAYSVSHPILYGTGVIPPAANTSVAFLALGSGLLGTCGRRMWSGEEDGIEPPPILPMLGILTLAIFLVLMPAYLLFRDYAADFRTEVEKKLLDVADLKVAQIESWRTERFSDASVFRGNPVFAGLLEASLYRDEAGASGQIEAWLRAVLEAYDYSRIVIVDSTGRRRLTVPDTGRHGTDGPPGVPAVLQAMRIDEVVIRDFHRDAPGGPVHLSVIAPVVAEGRALGAVVLRADPTTKLYPLLQRWPTRSRTAEILLVRREGDEVLFLNDLRFRQDAALDLRMPVSHRDLPAAQAVRGAEGIVVGSDYRGERAVAAVRKIPGAGWWLVAKMDVDEAFGPLRARLGWTVATAMMLLFGLAGLLGLAWQRRETVHYRDLARTEARYRDLVNSIRDAILVADTDRKIIGCNPAFTELFGYEKEELLGKRTAEIYASHEEFEAMGEKLRQQSGDPSFIQSARLRKKSGEVFTGETNAFHLTDSEGEVVGFIGLIRDVTRRLAAKRALEESEERYRTLVEAAPVGIFRTRSDGETLAVNQAMAEILGFDSADEVVRHYRDLAEQLYVRPERRTELLDLLRQQGHVEDFEYEARTPDGETVWIQMHGRVAGENADGTFDIEGFALDVTEDRRREEDLRQRQRMLEQTEEIALIGSWELEVETGEVEWSKELFRISGRDPSQGAPALEESDDLFPPDDLAQLRAVVQRAVEQAEPYELEVRIVRTDGEIRICCARGYPTHGQAGRVVRLYGMVEDITERRRREEREAELHRQLSQAQKMESIGRLAGGVAHDFNNMLSVILGHVELAQEQIDPGSSLHQDLGEVREAAERSAELTRKLLAFAREQASTPEVLNLNDTIGSTLRMLSRLIGENVELRWCPAREAWPIRMDPVQIDQVLTTLLVNARDAIEGVGRVTIEAAGRTVDAHDAETHPDARPGDYMVLSVSDTGAGMEPSVAERVFDPFFTTKAFGEGTGLGLAVVHGIVHQNNGFIHLSTEPGQGARFEIYLPRCLEEATEPPETTGAKTVEGTETVLVVEDQTSLLQLVARILKGLGYTVLTAETPGEAIEIAEEHSEAIQLLITDVIMPEMDGRELAERLEEISGGISVLYMSGYTGAVIADHGIIESDVAFIEKPFTRSELSAKVREVLEDR